MRVSYHLAALDGADLREHCKDLEFVECIPAETVSDLLLEAGRSDVLVVNNSAYNTEFAAALSRHSSAVKWIQLASTGFDRLQLLGVPERILVTNAANIWAPGVAEHACALILGHLRALHRAERKRAAFEWDSAGLCSHLGSLDGARVAIVGYGAVGREIAQRLRPFGAEVVAVVRRHGEYPLADEVCLIGDIIDRLPTVNIVVSTLPLSNDTKHLINRTWFDALPSSALFVNIGRGSTVVQADLVRALKEGQIGGAALDVTEVEPMPKDDSLWRSERLVLTPHLANRGHRNSSRRALALYRDNICRFHRNEKLKNLVIL